MRLIPRVGPAPGVGPQVVADRAEEPLPRGVRRVAGRHRARGHLPHRLRRQIEHETRLHRRVQGADRPLPQPAAEDVRGNRRAAQLLPRDAGLRHQVRRRRRYGRVPVRQERVLPHGDLVDADVVVLRHRRRRGGGILHGVRTRRHPAENHLRRLVHGARVVRGAALAVRHFARLEVDDHVGTRRAVRTDTGRLAVRAVTDDDAGRDRHRAARRQGDRRRAVAGHCRVPAVRLVGAVAARHRAGPRQRKGGVARQREHRRAVRRGRGAARPRDRAAVQVDRQRRERRRHVQRTLKHGARNELHVHRVGGGAVHLRL